MRTLSVKLVFLLTTALVCVITLGTIKHLSKIVELPTTGPIYELPIDTRSHDFWDSSGREMSIIIDKEGGGWVNGKRLDATELPDRLKQWSYKYGTDIPIFMYPDISRPFSEVWQIIENLKVEGFYMISLFVWQNSMGDLKPIQIWAPCIKGCLECVESPVVTTDTPREIFIDFNSKNAQIFTEEKITPVSWENLPRIVTRLQDLDPTISVIISINESMSYGEFIQTLCEVDPYGTESLVLLPQHHTLISSNQQETDRDQKSTISPTEPRELGPVD